MFATVPSPTRSRRRSRSAPAVLLPAPVAAPPGSGQELTAPGLFAGADFSAEAIPDTRLHLWKAMPEISGESMLPGGR